MSYAEISSISSSEYKSFTFDSDTFMLTTKNNMRFMTFFNSISELKEIITFIFDKIEIENKNEYYHKSLDLKTYQELSFEMLGLSGVRFDFSNIHLFYPSDESKMKISFYESLPFDLLKDSIFSILNTLELLPFMVKKDYSQNKKH